MSLPLSEAYGLLLGAAARSGAPRSLTAEIAREADGVDAEIRADIDLFGRNVQALAAAVNASDDVLDEALVLLRGSAMNLSTVLSNLADTVQQVLACR